MSSMRVRQVGLPFAIAVTLAMAGCGDDDDNGGTGPDPDTGSISGSVTADGSGVEDATIGLSGAATRSTTTDASGAYNFAQLAAGSYTVSITPPDGFELGSGEQADKSVTLTAGQDATVDWGLAATGGGGEVVEITAAGVSFSPQSQTVNVGETVRWVISSGGPHTVTPDDANQPGVWSDSGLLDNGETFEWVVPEAAAGQTIEYHCNPHESAGMTGTITVNAQ